MSEGVNTDLMHELAAAGAHTTNNLRTLLFAASGYLEASSDTPANPRLLRVIGEASRTAHALASAWSVLAARQPADDTEVHWRRLSVRDLDSALGCLADDAGLESSGLPKDWGGVTYRASSNLLQSLLGCAVHVLRRRHGASVAVSCRVDASSADALVFTLACPGEAADKPAAAHAHRHACEIALAECRQELAAFGVEVTEGREIRVLLQTRP
ncbi:MAG: hypothetical protein ACKO4A_18865 [Gammaproteobacteria bacterium]